MTPCGPPACHQSVSAAVLSEQVIIFHMFERSVSVSACPSARPARSRRAAIKTFTTDAARKRASMLPAP
jgi:hypothetical protein